MATKLWGLYPVLLASESFGTGGIRLTFYILQE